MGGLKKPSLASRAILLVQVRVDASPRLWQAAVSLREKNSQNLADFWSTTGR